VTAIKVCGITRPDDARLAADLGAWAVGFVFWPGSPRCVDPDTARAIVDTLPAPVTAVGVFVNADRDEIERVAAHVRLGVVQLHGDESPALAQSLTRRVLKATTLAACTEDALAPWAGVDLLLDAHDPARRGGTGQTIDWQAARARGRRAAPSCSPAASGPRTWKSAIEIVRPAAVDVSSGIEREPGVKDHARMRALFEVVRRASEVTR
jgi:phosphoribosylanthranilate isomerase